MEEVETVFGKIDGIKRTFYLSSADIASTLLAYLDVEKDKDFAGRIRVRVGKSFEDEIRIFSGARDAIVLSTLHGAFDKPELIEAYLAREVAREEDADLRHLRLGMFRTAVTIH